eukprot:Tamp_27174.p3 GENE.Tamp_27174~~Tamp_27174.p3  ORF type:complete len:139 (-),score=5.10 Tamp_27174:250-666(-)
MYLSPPSPPLTFFRTYMSPQALGYPGLDLELAMSSELRLPSVRSQSCLLGSPAGAGKERSVDTAPPPPSETVPAEVDGPYFPRALQSRVGPRSGGRHIPRKPLPRRSSLRILQSLPGAALQAPAPHATWRSATCSQMQ